MLPDMPSFRKKFFRKVLLAEYERARRAAGPIVSQIPVVTQHEGVAGNYATVQGNIRETQFRSLRGEYSVSPREIIDSGISKALEIYNAVGAQVGRQQEQNLLDMINRSCDETGNSVDAQGQPLDFEIVMRMLEKMEIDFDLETGMPRLPTFVYMPNQSANIRKMILDSQDDEERRRRFDTLIGRKREEWIDRENHRQLVD